jgi:hypothetical protein
MKELLERIKKTDEYKTHIPGFIKTCECKFKEPDTIIGKVDFQNHRRVFYQDYVRTYCPVCGIEFPKENAHGKEGDI